MANASFQTIGVLGRVKTEAVRETLIALIHYLRTLTISFVVEKETADTLHDPTIRSLPKESLVNDCDLLIVVGGDGSLLHAAHIIMNTANTTKTVPILGVNRGKLGFLTDISPNELNKIADILNGDFTIEKRFLLSATAFHEDKILGRENALNEMALIPDLIPHMISFEIYIDKQLVCGQDSDGLIIATPTGSTAYALSGGGPILHPSLNAFVLVPMFPQTLSMRPIVINADTDLRINILSNNITTPRLTCDGQACITLPPGSRIEIKKMQEAMHLIHPLDYDYYASLRSKLHWGRKVK